MRTVFGDHQRFIDTYFKTFPGKYFTGDGAKRDADGYYWITGRVDMSSMSRATVSARRSGKRTRGASASCRSRGGGCPHDIKGQGIYCYVTLNADAQPSEALRSELRDWVRKEIGPIATPDFIQWAPGLPKTRSGKIMRRILRKIAAKRTRPARRHFDIGGPERRREFGERENEQIRRDS